jgi:hypothetical protein
VLGSAALVIAVVYVPQLQEAFATVSLGPLEAAVTLPLGALPALAIESAKAVRARGVRASADARSAFPPMAARTR